MTKSLPVSTLSSGEARGLLDELTDIQTTTRARLHASGWQWLVIWAVAFFGAALTGFVPALTDYADVYWLVATPSSIVLTILVSVRVDARSPVRQRSLPYWLVGAAITVASFGMSAFLPDEAIVVAIWVVFGFGFAGFAWLERVTPAVWLLSGMAIISGVLGLLVDDTFALYPALALAFAAALAGVIAGMRIKSGN